MAGFIARVGLRRETTYLAGLVLTLIFAGSGCGRSAFGDFVRLSGDDGGQSVDDTEGDSAATAGSITASGDSAQTDTSPDDGCEIAAQCELGDPCSTPACIDGECIYTPRDLDEDGFAPFECGGDDCNDLNPNTNPAAVENCFDADDNDCNGVADCLDPVCEGVPDCGCTPSPAGEVCTNGQDDDCDTTVDCNDTDCIGTPACGCSMAEAGLCGNGFDDDCDDAIDCDDPDCAGDEICTCMAATEDCGNNSDDDCDLLIDCADPDCEGIQGCACVGEPTPEVCGDGADNDCDTLVDCADPDCVIAAECAMCMPELCNDGLDNNCDNLIDCADAACAFDPGCAATPELCNNDLDDDNDGLTDCDDPDCANVPSCAQNPSNCATAALIPGTGSYFGDTTGHTSNTDGSCGGDAGEAVYYFVLTEPSRVLVDTQGTSFDSVLYLRGGSCGLGFEIGCDDDSGGALAAALDFTLLLPGTYFVFVDGFTIDPIGGANEGPYQLNIEIIENPSEICNDGIDNDGDVYADCADPDCSNLPPCAGCNGGANPTAEFGPDACTDGQDNDCDGLFDCADDDCSASDYYVTECCNNTDENGNGIPDDFNCRCNNDSECPQGQMCYTHTANSCGIPCNQFFGDVCPFVAAGSTCNLATSQCEF